MNSLEVDFLFLLNFHCFVSTRTYKIYYQELFAHANISNLTCGCSFAQVPPLILSFQDDASSDKETKSGIKDEMLMEPTSSTEEDAEGNSSMKKDSSTTIESDTLMVDPRSKRRHIERDMKGERLGELSGWQSPIRSSPGGFGGDGTPKVTPRMTPRMTPELDAVMTDSPCTLQPIPRAGDWINI